MLLITFIFFCSCFDKEPRSCVNAELSKKIIVDGFHHLKKENIKLFKIKKKTNRILDSFTTKEIYSFPSSENKRHIVFDKQLYSQGNYRLIIDSVKYDITNIKIRSKPIMKGMIKDSSCTIYSFKINGKIAIMIGSAGMINFKKPDY